MFNEINSEKFDLEYQIAEDIKTYIIASTPRSGSTLLGEVLKQTNLAGSPHEFLHDKHSKDYIQRWHTSNIQEYIQSLKSYRSTNNKIFGAKIHYHQLSNFNIKNSELNTLFNNPKYIFIRRKDKLDQAISLSKALQSRQWAISEGEKLSDSEYSYNQIKNSLIRLDEEEKEWKTFFIKNNIKYFEIYYEDFIKDMNQYLKDILSFLDIDYTTIEKINPPIKKMRNKESKQWKERFLKEDKECQNYYQ